MKLKLRLSWLLMLVGMASLSFGQNAEHPHSLRVSGGVQDSYGPFKGDNFPFGIWNTDNLDLAFQLQYMKYYSEFIDFGANLTATSTKHFYDKDFPNTGPGQYIDNGSAIDLDLVSRFKFYNGNDIKENALFKPYLYTGVSGSYISELENKRGRGNNFAANVPMGLGFKIGKGEKVNFDLNGAFRIGLFNKIPNRWEYQAGFAFNFGQKKEEPAPPPVVQPAPKDTDGDGIIDVNDDCPTVAGIAQFNGCPDTDGDGIPDSEDECPTEAGIARLNGCPAPVDTDGDGIPDDMDECPTEAGPKETNGCPVEVIVIEEPDRDGDGIADKYDLCPDTPGVVEEKGCPKPTLEVIEQLNFIARSIFFKFNSHELAYESKAKLDEIADIMKRFPNAKFLIAGHTDSKGSAEYNKKLSQERADSVVKYLVSKGIPASNLSSIGYGEEQPIATNDTEEGRQQNRRVVISLNN